jgi:CRP-like cAMP-binding protein
VLGSDGERLHEEIVQAGGSIEEGRFVAMKQDDLARALSGRTEQSAPEAFLKRMQALWPRIEGAILKQLERRVTDRTRGLTRLLEDRCEKEIADIRQIMSELETAIREELNAPEPAQLELWTSTEREQLSRNLAGLRRRLVEIPAEIQAETEAIRKRYAEPVPRMFPVAVEFLVPSRMARA